MSGDPTPYGVLFLPSFSLSLSLLAGRSGRGGRPLTARSNGGDGLMARRVAGHAGDVIGPRRTDSRWAGSRSRGPSRDLMLDAGCWMLVLGQKAISLLGCGPTVVHC